MQPIPLIEDSLITYRIEEVKDEEKQEITFQKYIRFKIKNIQLLVSEMQIGFVLYTI
ncbi:hypothetical protein [Priestia megaterium]|uniref:hypothetical protein n=1 Tax=Priestia megaterium TaxID=1404 RepID=UPI001642CE05|nr:hypothetical protein [Priestia megaterium]